MNIVEETPVARDNARTSAPSAKHISELDGIRGFATVLVVLYHYASSGAYEFGWSNPVVRMLKLGWAGVDLFFVLSGFLITGILLDAKAKPDYFKNFYTRRALRIFPLYYTALVVFGLVQLRWPDGALAAKEPLFWVWIYATNVILSIKGQLGFGGLDHFWSLAVEEHFYLVWPFIVLAFSKQRLLWISAGTLIVSLAVRVALVIFDAEPSAPYFLTPARVDSLATGALVVLLVREKGIESLKRPAIFALLGSGAAFLILVGLRGKAQHSDPGISTVGLSLLAVLFGATLILARSLPVFSKFFNWGSLRFLGKYSYGLYVWHPFVFVLVFHSETARRIRGEVNLGNILLSTAVALAGSALLTGLSWTLIERRFLRLKHRFH